jgi:hypothetical protein
MIYNVRTYTVQPRLMKKYVGMFESMALPAAKRLGMRLIGYFISQNGALNQVVHIWAYESLAEYETIRAARDEDADWEHFLDSTVGLLVAQEDKFMRPASFSPLQ